MSGKNMLQTSDVEHRIAGKIDQSVTGRLEISQQAGGLAFVSVQEVMEFAKMMAVGNISVRKHLRGNVGACLGVTIQAVEWKMSPYAVANKSYLVNDQLAYEAQLIHAVVLSRSPIKGRPQVEYTGEGNERVCRVFAELNDGSGQIVEYESPPFGKIQPKNSPLWKNDPDQQHWYYSVRAWCRRHFPDVILGVYAEDEFDAAAFDVAERERPAAAKTIGGRLDALVGTDEDEEDETGLTIEHEPTGKEDESSEVSGKGDFTETDEADAPGRASEEPEASDEPSEAPAPSKADKPVVTAEQVAKAKADGADARKRGRSRKIIPAAYQNSEELTQAYRDGFDDSTAEG